MITSKTDKNNLASEKADFNVQITLKLKKTDLDLIDLAAANKRVSRAAYLRMAALHFMKQKR